MAKSKPMKIIYENSPNLERVARAYARLVEQQEGVTLESVTWLEKRTGEVHVTEVRTGCTKSRRIMKLGCAATTARAAVI